jgi:hypothetical protein
MMKGNKKKKREGKIIIKKLNKNEAEEPRF